MKVREVGSGLELEISACKAIQIVMKVEEYLLQKRYNVRILP